jgi:hypothetical protein
MMNFLFAAVGMGDLLHGFYLYCFARLYMGVEKPNLKVNKSVAYWYLANAKGIK